MPEPKLIEDRHLGDGVYASFDGHHIVLDLRAQDSFTKIALEPEVFHRLIDFRTDLETRRAEAKFITAKAAHG